jgi:large subunit ribosomal protein L23
VNNTKTEKELIIASSHVSECTNMIKYPIITDKATRLLANNQYSFVVDPKAKKPTIKAAIQYLFNVKVIKINTAHLPKKKKRVGQYMGWKPHYKKAIVTLAEGDTINLFAEEN